MNVLSYSGVYCSMYLGFMQKLRNAPGGGGPWGYCDMALRGVGGRAAQCDVTGPHKNHPLPGPDYTHMCPVKANNKNLQNTVSCVL